MAQRGGQATAFESGNQWSLAVSAFPMRAMSYSKFGAGPRHGTSR